MEFSHTVDMPDRKAGRPARPDHRFRTLLADHEWDALPHAIQKRFSKSVKDGESTIYVGTITEMRMSRLGRVWANMLRIVGAPLPLHAEVGTPSIVSVTEDGVKGGQVWTRLYASRRGFPQIVHSAKRFSGPTGLEEYVGFGLSISLLVKVVDRGLQFESAGYVMEIFGKRCRLPRCITPLDLIVRHEDAGADRFVFSLELTSPWTGELIHQTGVYREERH